MAKQKALYNRLLPGQEVFGSFEAADILSIKRSLINNDMKQGFFPDGTKVKWGRTVRTVFSRQELYWMSLFYELHRMGLNKRQANEIVQRIRGEVHDFILLTPSIHQDEPAGRLQFKNYLTAQALDKIKNARATILINYKQIRQDLDKRIGKTGNP
jgi:hypothetical protein